MLKIDDVRRIWRAVLARAVLDLCGRRLEGEHPATARREVLLWLGTPDFFRCCELAGADPRRTLMRLREL